MTHELYDTYTLRIANHPASKLITNTNGFFSMEIPPHLRQKDCYASVVSGTVGDLDNIFEGTEDQNLLILRHNILTFSYDVTTKGTDKSFGTLIRPANNEKIAKLNEDVAYHLGLVRLPPILEVESIGFVTATGAETRLDKANHFTEIILRLDFPKD